MDDSYDTIASPSTVELKEKGSRFIAEIAFAESADIARAQLQTIRKREHAASHHCYAYVVREKEQVQFKYSDDGEPNGTAGKPIYDVITGNNLQNLICVVTRYFGGTKLGAGGLSRAYGASAKAAIEQAGKKTVYFKSNIRLEFSFPVYDQVNRLLQKLGAEVTNSDFSQDVKLELQIRRSLADELHNQYAELTGGKGRFDLLER